MSAVADVLNGAADLIERDGWVQGEWRRGTRRCADGAIMTVCPLSRAADVTAAREIVAAVTGHPLLVDFNDAPGRTQAEVVAALRAAAMRAL